MVSEQWLGFNISLVRHVSLPVEYSEPLPSWVCINWKLHNNLLALPLQMYMSSCPGFSLIRIAKKGG